MRDTTASAASGRPAPFAPWRRRALQARGRETRAFRSTTERQHRHERCRRGMHQLHTGDGGTPWRNGHSQATWPEPRTESGAMRRQAQRLTIRVEAAADPTTGRQLGKFHELTQPRLFEAPAISTGRPAGWLRSRSRSRPWVASLAVDSVTPIHHDGGVY